VGSKIARLTVRPVDELEAVVQRHQVSIGVIATPAGSAQAVCDRLVAAGVTSILNFAPLVLTVPEGVDVRKVDLSIELQILAFHAQRRSAAQPQSHPDRGTGTRGAQKNGAQKNGAQKNSAQKNGVSQNGPGQNGGGRHVDGRARPPHELAAKG
jgi:redox-sensing transcriptional repressor